MAPVDQIAKAITYLRSEVPQDDISTNPVVKHPHNTARTVPERLPAATIKELSALDPARAIAATAQEWLAIISAIALCSFFWNPVLYLAAIIMIGSRQHALPDRQRDLDVADLRLGGRVPQVPLDSSSVHKSSRRREPAYLVHP
jgi:hypothetical protein